MKKNLRLYPGPLPVRSCLTTSCVSRQATWLVSILLFSIRVSSALVPFKNCLATSIQNSQSLQFLPLYVDAHFTPIGAAHKLNLTIYGNTTGLRPDEQQMPYPPPTSSVWNDDSNSFGKIVDQRGESITTLFFDLDFLSYTAHHAPPTSFCNATLSQPCPWGPLFGQRSSDLASLHSFTVYYDLDSDFAFSTITATIKIQTVKGSPDLACINLNITPDLGSHISAVIRWIPMVILSLVAIATILTAKFHPSSSKNFFYWSSNYGREHDMTRLLTPGFGDCLQYIQFVVLAGSLSLNYPGYYQPVVSQASWSNLIFNESFISDARGSNRLIDGMYITKATFGLSTLAQLAGMQDDSDMWTGMAVWLSAIIAIVIVVCQLGFMAQYIFQMWKKSKPQDLRRKNFPFTAGQVTRIVYNYFLLPIISLSTFQLVIAGHTPNWVVGLSILLLLTTIGFVAWACHLILTTNPIIHLFDHLPSLLLYGPLYNTYSDTAISFAVVPIVLNVIRGIAIGAVQASGIAQLVILAICEVIFILTIHAFRPFQAITSMNAFHTSFATVRFLTLILSISFVPSLGIAEGTKGWIGYVNLFLHAVVLIFGFFLNAIQTLIEVFARMSGARESPGGILHVFGSRQLSKRIKRNHSLNSSTAMLAAGNTPSSDRYGATFSGSLRHSSFGTIRSVEQLDPPINPSSWPKDSYLISGQSPPLTLPANQTTAYYPVQKTADSQSPTFRRHSSVPQPGPYYRSPRQRRYTLESAAQMADIELRTADSYHAEQGSRDKIIPARQYSLLSSTTRDESEDMRKQNSDYYLRRESDFFYGFHRGPALSNSPTIRRRKTGPADPTSPISTMAGWVKRLVVGRNRDRGRGFEVVRSTPLHQLQEQDEEAPNVSSNHIHQDQSCRTPPPPEVLSETTSRSVSSVDANIGTASDDINSHETLQPMPDSAITFHSTSSTFDIGRPNNLELNTKAYHPTHHHSSSQPTPTRTSSKGSGPPRSDSFQRTSYADRDWIPNRRTYFDSFLPSLNNDNTIASTAQRRQSTANLMNTYARSP